MGGSWAKRPVLKKTGCNRSTTSLFDFQQTWQLATGLITIHRNWQLQSSCDQLRSSPVASLCTSCQLDFETLVATGRPNGHKVQKCSLCDTKSGRRERVERHKANSRKGESGERGWHKVMVLRAGGRGLRVGSGTGGRRW